MRSHPLLKKILSVPSYGQRPDVGLLVLRIGIFASLFIKHGLEKIDPASFAEMAPTFPDPAHIGHVPSLLVATVSDGFCSVLIVLGAAKEFILRYAKLAIEMLETADTPERAANLREVARICDQLAVGGAETFREAVQAPFVTRGMCRF